MYSIKLLLNQRLRFLLTVTGISLCIVLMLFLISVYSGIDKGTLDYIRENKTDLWVMQKNTWNILRGISLVPEIYGKGISQIEGVKSIAPVEMLIFPVSWGKPVGMVYLVDYDIVKKKGGPPKLFEGRQILNDNEVIIDKAFCRKHGFSIGNQIIIKEDTLTIVGISSGSNMFVIQYAFVSLKKAHDISGLNDIVSCFLVDIKPGYDPIKVKAAIKKKIPVVDIYTYDEFLDNNRKEMQNGILVFIYTIAAISIVVLIVILSLILTIGILEMKKEFATMKILGAPIGFIPSLVIFQSLFIYLVSSIIAIILYFPLTYLVLFIAPEIESRFTFWNMLVVIVIGCVMSLSSSIISLRRLRKIYMPEVFS